MRYLQKEKAVVKAEVRSNLQKDNQTTYEKENTNPNEKLKSKLIPIKKKVPGRKKKKFLNPKSKELRKIQDRSSRRRTYKKKKTKVRNEESRKKKKPLRFVKKKPKKITKFLYETLPKNPKAQSKPKDLKKREETKR